MYYKPMHLASSISGIRGGNDTSTKEASGGNLKFRQELKDVIEVYPEETAEETLEHNTF